MYAVRVLRRRSDTAVGHIPARIGGTGNTGSRTGHYGVRRTVELDGSRTGHYGARRTVELDGSRTGHYGARRTVELDGSRAGHYGARRTVELDGSRTGHYGARRTVELDGSRAGHYGARRTVELNRTLRDTTHGGTKSDVTGHDARWSWTEPGRGPMQQSGAEIIGCSKIALR